MHIGMDETSLSGKRILVSISKTQAGIGVAVITLQNRHGVIVLAVLDMHDTGDSRCIVRSVRLEFSGAQGLLKGQLFVHSLVDSICLVTVGHDDLVTKDTYGCVDDQTGIFQFGRIESLGTDSLSLCHEHTITAVGASSHNKIRGYGIFTVRRASDHDTSAGISITFQFLFQL